MLKQVNDRILVLNAIDKQYKTAYETFASLIEEAGEFATELKIHQKTFSNSHKVSEEGPKAELVDFYIMCVCWFDWNNHLREENYRNGFIQSVNEFMHKTEVIENIFDYFHNLIKNVMSYCFHSASSKIFNIFLNYLDGTPEEFVEIANRKLDKWELSQQKCMETIQNNLKE